MSCLMVYVPRGRRGGGGGEAAAAKLTLCPKNWCLLRTFLFSTVNYCITFHSGCSFLAFQCYMNWTLAKKGGKV